jgi:hypothetical protein
MKLTKTQRQAIERPGGNLQLIACAGSGKTEVVAGPTAGEERIRTPGAMRVSSLPKAAQNWALFVTHQIAIKISGENVAFCSPEPRWLQRPSEVRRGDKAARRTPAADPGKAENDWLPAGQRANVVSCPGKGGAPPLSTCRWLIFWVLGHGCLVIWLVFRTVWLQSGDNRLASVPTRTSPDRCLFGQVLERLQ